MPSKNMLPKGQRRRTVRPQYVATRGVEPAGRTPVPEIALTPLAELAELGLGQTRSFVADASAAGLRLDQYLAQALPDVSRARVQMLIAAGQVRVNGTVPKPKGKLKGGETIAIEGEPIPDPLHASPEDIPLTLLYEDQYLAVVDKPAGMAVHAGAGESDDDRNKGTLVNALLFRFAADQAKVGLSTVGGELRPGLVHRLDKLTSGAIVVAKDDGTHRELSAMFAAREVHKTYIALAHGHLRQEKTTVALPIARDLVRRTRMTTRRTAEAGARSAVSHVQVVERLDTAYGAFTLVEVTIETGRTHQIRVHLQALGHPVVGDTLYGAAGVLHAEGNASLPDLSLDRNFLHAARLAFRHPQTGEELALEAPLAPELTGYLQQLRVAPKVSADAPEPNGRSGKQSIPAKRRR